MPQAFYGTAKIRNKYTEKLRALYLVCLKGGLSARMT